MLRLLRFSATNDALTPRDLREGFRGHAEIACLVAAAGFLHLDDIRAQIAQDLRGGRAREHAREIQHPDTLQDRGHVASHSSGAQGYRPFAWTTAWPTVTFLPLSSSHHTSSSWIDSPSGLSRTEVTRAHVISTWSS